MLRLNKMTWLVLLALLGADSQNDRFKRLHSVETYEFKPGILIRPTYSAHGDICNVVIEKRHVSGERVDLDAEMSSEQLLLAFDELAPPKERGQPKANLGDGGEITTVEGPTLVTRVEYERISLDMYGRSGRGSGTTYVAAVIQWKNQGCGREYK